MKRFVICTFLVIAFGVYTHVEAQFKVSQIALGLSLGGAHGTNAGNDKWVPQYRGFLQQKLFTPMLLGQLGLGFTDLESDGPGAYSAQIGILDLRLLFSPFSLSNLDPYFYAGFGVTKTFNVSNSDILAMVPFGVGIQTRIASGILLDLNGGYNLSLSDKMDGQLRTNALNDLTNQKQDGFYGFTAGLAFTIGGVNEEAEAAKNKQLAEAEARRVKAAEDARHAKELAQAEARRVQQRNDADAAARAAKEAADLAARNAKEAADLAARNAKTTTDVAAQNAKQSADAEARRVKELADAEARRLADQKSRDTLFVLIKGKTVVLRGVNFDFNKATLTKDSERILYRAYNAMVANPTVRVVITGHTDNVGGQKFNQDLSLKRAQAVKNWLVKKGIASNRMRTVGRGLNEPVATNDTEEGRAENRRMEFYVQ
jgi:outer membrane protein OmpA-like peptidoglycan-associated protein